jgi:hypothetical protein
VPVRNRGVVFDPPNEHLGITIADAGPIRVADTAIVYLDTIINEAQRHVDRIAE